MTEARTRLGLGRSLIALGSEDDARPELERARVVFADLAAAAVPRGSMRSSGRRAQAPA